MDSSLFYVGAIVKHTKTNEKFRVAREPDQVSIELIGSEALISLDAVERKKTFQMRSTGDGFYYPRRLVRAKNLIPQMRST